MDSLSKDSSKRKKVPTAPLNKYFYENEIYCGAVSGSLIHIKDNVLRKENTVYRNPSRVNCEVTSLSWRKQEDKPYELLVGYQDGGIFIFDTEKKDFNMVLCVEEKKRIYSMIPLPKPKNLLALTENGLYLCDLHDRVMNPIQKFERPRAARVAVMNPFAKQNIAFGGIDLDLNIMDVDTQKIVFKAKNDPNDALGLRQEVNLSGITFLSENMGNLIATCSQQGVFRVFDPRTQRRAVIKHVHQKNPCYTCISGTSIQDRIAVGTNKGVVQFYDVRKSKAFPATAVQCFMGGVVDLATPEGGQGVFALSADRHLNAIREEEMKTDTTEYLKIRINKLAVHRHERYTKQDDVSTDEDEKERVKLKKKKGQHNEEKPTNPKKPKLQESSHDEESDDDEDESDN